MEDLKSTRKLLLLKQQYNVRDDDPIFLFLDGFGNLHDRMVETIGGVNEIEKLIYMKAEQLLENTRIMDELNEKINKKAKEIPTFIMHEVRGEISYIQEEIVRLGSEIEHTLQHVSQEQNRYISKLNHLTNSVNTFTNAMEKIEKKQPSALWMYIFTFTMLVLQSVSFLLLFKK